MSFYFIKKHLEDILRDINSFPYCFDFFSCSNVKVEDTDTSLSITDYFFGYIYGNTFTPIFSSKHL